MTNNYVVTDSRNWRQGSGLGSDDNLTRRRWKRFSGEEGGSFVLGDGVGVEVVAGAGQAGHGVAGGGAHAPLCQMKSGSGKISLRGSIKRINFKPKLDVSASCADNCSWSSSSHLEQTLLDNPVSEAVSDIVKESQSTGGVDPAIGSLLGPIWSENLLPVLSSVGLEPKEPVCSQISLDMILGCKVLCKNTTTQQHRHSHCGYHLVSSSRSTT